jgi:hypothetical protein
MSIPGSSLDAICVIAVATCGPVDATRVNATTGCLDAITGRVGATVGRIDSIIGRTDAGFSVGLPEPLFEPWTPRLGWLLALTTLLPSVFEWSA